MLKLVEGSEGRQQELLRTGVPQRPVLCSWQFILAHTRSELHVRDKYV